MNIRVKNSVSVDKISVILPKALIFETAAGFMYSTEEIIKQTSQTLSDGQELLNTNIVGISYGTTIEFCREIADKAFYVDNISNSVLTYVNVPTSVTKIGESAFRACLALKTVTIPDSVTSIGAYAFAADHSITSIRLPSTLTTIPNELFTGCTSLAIADIPSTVESIGQSAFYGCNALKSVSFPSVLTSIGAQAFYGNKTLTEITIPASVTSIGTYTFASCPSIATMTVDSANTVYDSRNDCNAIIETATNKLISGCRNSVIPSTVTSIENGAFFGCSTLSSVTIPAGVTSIGTRVFSDCPGLATIIVESGNTKYDSRNGCNAIIETSTNKLLYGCYNTSIPDTVIGIGDNAFRGEVYLKGITIPSNIASIGSYAFYNCEKLESVKLPYSLETLGNFAFYNCMSMTSLTLGSSILSIGSSAFYGCPLTSISFKGTKDEWNSNSALTGYFGEITSDGSTTKDSSFGKAVPVTFIDS